MKRSCPASARSTATRSSRAIEVEKGEYVLLDPEEIEKVKLESRKTLELTQFVDLSRHRPDLLRQALFRRPRRRPCRGSVRRPARGAAPGEEGRHRPAGDARPGICRQPEGVRARDGARNVALRRRGQQGASYFRDIGDAKPDADLLDLAATLIEKKAGEFDASRVPEPLHRCAARPDRREAEEEGQARHPGQRAPMRRPRARTSST